MKDKLIVARFLATALAVLLSPAAMAAGDSDALTEHHRQHSVTTYYRSWQEVVPGMVVVIPGTMLGGNFSANTRFALQVVNATGGQIIMLPTIIIPMTQAVPVVGK